ncbi:adenylate/guanylate cyclase domain-containing protein [Algiphilus sp.]|uniref:adenylate/guanylate cyclase domain-containing protein n=1 Tax=Algiphilus sp. TaxID=1872431 RepID=UPI001CA66E03|nr:adenylate/guanylate cyclase domain-containing protein [Algiphilus sp.]MBY8966584.1 adenylate/guanylate cyclase domain-containing protein [Algiphilus acroporae]MCI5062763.1 adenylate/guanylate cyclase domain-containing protein [Algiphilus sp.]MCI5103209.1 adenylate/guanylate cyclase domain-containing protein [Algiphilus sp.]MCR9090461.1 adenylate/guanylate cyclase domain-containing protein [Pseudomonadota bacterium]
MINQASGDAIILLGMMTFGAGAIFAWFDRHMPASRALALCLLAIGARLLLDQVPNDGLTFWSWVTAAVIATLEAIAMGAGVEWARRIGQTAQQRFRYTTGGLFLASQALIVVYWGLSIGYLAISPEQAASDAPGMVTVRPLEWALFAPILGTSMLLATVAVSLLLMMRIDPAESARLISLSLAAPFLLAGLMIREDWVPFSVGIALLIFIAGSVRYLILQSRRGQFMSQFLSPEVARMVRLEGMERALHRERRLLSVVACDLRGFTTFARTTDSERVVALLEDYYQVIGRVAAEHGGTVKDHAGDGVLILVGAPAPVEDHARRAILLALQLVRDGQALLRANAPELGLGVGVTTGHATVGAIQGASRLEYVAIGNPVNLAARLCDRAEDGEVLSDTRTVEALRPDDGIHTQERPPQPLKGFAEPIPVCAVSAEVLPPYVPEHRRRKKWRSLRGRKRRARRLEGAPS